MTAEEEHTALGPSSTGDKIDKRLNRILVATGIILFAILASLGVTLPSVLSGARNSAALKKVSDNQAKTQVVSDCKSKITGDAEIAVGDGVKIVIDAQANPDPAAAFAQLQTDARAEKAEIDRTQARRRQINELCSPSNAAKTLKEETP